MNFDDILDSLGDEDTGFEIPSSTDDFQRSKLSIESIRKTMKSEVAVQLAAMLIFFAVLFIEKLDTFSFAIYAIFISITCIFTALYLIKLVGFIKSTARLSLNTRASLFSFIYDLKLTLEVYKTAIIAGSILLPIPMAALVMGSGFIGSPEDFEKYFLFQGSPLETMATIGGFILLAIFFYFLTLWWTEHMYGKHIEEIQETLTELET